MTFEFKPKLAKSFEWMDNNTSLLVTLELAILSLLVAVLIARRALRGFAQLPGPGCQAADDGVGRDALDGGECEVELAD